ncbi:MAG: hypothetical protein IPN25_04075 [Sphingobacteriales bacterium]|jgi:hypothetical protein|nr:hypothetical protein [Sphingobacteriales bacterium]HMS51966.1 hypothetical protein [Chitinophagales bacterium]
MQKNNPLFGVVMENNITFVFVMKTYFCNIYGRWFFISWLVATISLTYACNTTRDNTPQTAAQTSTNAKPNITTKNTKSTDAVDDIIFGQLDPYQQWLSLTPSRRNYIRENLNDFPQYRDFALADPNLEADETQQTNTHNALPDTFVATYKNKFADRTPADWWNSFNEARKQHIRQNIDLYPEFKPFVEKK